MAIFIVLVAAAFLTAFYMGRQVLMVFFGDARTDAAKHAKESSLLVTMPLMILALLSVLGGALNLPGMHTLEHWLEETLIITHPAEFIVPIAVGSLVVALVALLLAYLVYGRKPLANAKAADPLAKRLGVIFRWMNQKFMVDELYQAVVIGPYHKLADFFANPVDLGVIDGVVNGLGSLTTSFAGMLRKLQTGFARTYALSIFAGLILILVYILTRI